MPERRYSARIRSLSEVQAVRRCVLDWRMLRRFGQLMGQTAGLEPQSPVA